MRYISSDVEATLTEKKMAFIAGPRQVGKTTLAQALLKRRGAAQGYFNWDIDAHRQAILKNPAGFWLSLPQQIGRLAFDEIHKFPRWKRFLKGFYDAHRDAVQTIVTGSGRLDIYQRGGDSLFGRYHLHRLFPFSVGELIAKDQPPLSPEESFQKSVDEQNVESKSAFEQLWNFNGFPEPLFKAEQRALIRWQNDRQQLVLREDLRDLTQIRELGLVESLITLLPERIGAPLSINALREDIGVNFKTVQGWLTNLDRLYYLFFLRPYSGRLARTLRREEKVYFYDWSLQSDEGKRFENMLALHLLKACSYWTDAGYGDFRLHYVRDKEKREVDFLICDRRRPYALIEAKYTSEDIDSSLVYFAARLKPRFSFQIVGWPSDASLLKQHQGITLCAASRFLAGLP